MARTITIGGKDYPYIKGNKIIKEFEKNTGLNTIKMNLADDKVSANYTSIVKLIYDVISLGFKKEEKDPPSMDDVFSEFVEIDEVFSAYIEIFTVEKKSLPSKPRKA